MNRSIKPVVRKAKLGQLDDTGERLAYWLQQPLAARIAEVEVLRRVWRELTGDPDQPIARVVFRRRLGEKSPIPA